MAKNNRQDDEDGGARSASSVTLSWDRASGESESVALVCIAERDHPVVQIGLELLVKRCDQVLKSLKSLDVDDGEVTRRQAEAQHLLDSIAENNPLLKLGFPIKFLRTVRVALVLEWEKVQSVLEAQQGLLIENDSTSTRSKQVSRLLSELDVVGMQETQA